MIIGRLLVVMKTLLVLMVMMMMMMMLLVTMTMMLVMLVMLMMSDRRFTVTSQSLYRYFTVITHLFKQQLLQLRISVILVHYGV